MGLRWGRIHGVKSLTPAGAGTPLDSGPPDTPEAYSPLAKADTGHTFAGKTSLGAGVTTREAILIRNDDSSGYSHSNRPSQLSPARQGMKTGGVTQRKLARPHPWATRGACFISRGEGRKIYRLRGG